MDGVIVVDKPEGWTSHDVVNKVRRLAGTKAGHLGTLDPIATGVLPLVLGKATRLAQFYTRSGKIYEALVRFGWSTTTYDRAGEATSEKREVALTAPDLEVHLERFRGEFLQTPPPVSAKKVDGKRAYQLARQSIAVELEPVQVQVYELELLEVNGALARMRAHCSGGTYMRSIAHDLGQAMGCGAHLEQLRRTLSGEFEMEMARTIPQLQQLIIDERLVDALVPAVNLLPGFPTVYVDDLTVAQIRNGRNFPASPFRSDPASKYVKAVSRQGELVAIGEAVLPNLYHPAVVL
ncbi:tRNA pseudouridine synthase B [Candidatus Sulfopaludibacter sp. SbA3]|nr:tRNA pseudouridine synthase B [Candidatus Sulfopaludibacter sp. SbA3]